MTMPIATQGQIEGIVRQLRALDRRVGRIETIERLLTLPLTPRTPTYTGGTTAGVTTYAFQSAAYVQLGNIVIDIGQINWTAATGTGEARISLPVTPLTYNAAGSVWISGVTFANSTPLILAGPGNLYFTLDSPLTNAAPTRVQMEAGGSLVWVIVYPV